MKIVRIIIFLSSIVLLSGCEGLGWNGCIMRDTLTPNVSQDETIRTWDNSK